MGKVCNVKWSVSWENYVTWLVGNGLWEIYGKIMSHDMGKIWYKTWCKVWSCRRFFSKIRDEDSGF